MTATLSVVVLGSDLMLFPSSTLSRWWLLCRPGHGHEAPGVAAAAAHLDHKLAGAKVGHDLKGRETEEQLAARGVIHAGSALRACSGTWSRAVALYRACRLLVV